MAEEKIDLAGGKRSNVLPIDTILMLPTDQEAMLKDKNRMKQFWYSLKLFREMINIDENEESGNDQLIELAEENRGKILAEIDDKNRYDSLTNERVIEGANQIYAAWKREEKSTIDSLGNNNWGLFTSKGVSVLDVVIREFENERHEFAGLKKAINPFASLAMKAEELNLDKETRYYAKLANKVITPYLFGMMDVVGGVRNQWMGKFGDG